MKVCQLNYSAGTGGAARASLRIHRALNESGGIVSEFYANQK